MKRGRLALGFAICLVVPAGCVLLVDDAPTFGGHCQVKGASSVCGQCLAQNCQASVDACCGDPQCDATRLDQCALGSCMLQTPIHAWQVCALSACASACGVAVADSGVDGNADADTDAAKDAAEDAFSPPTITGCTTSINSCSCSAGAVPNGVVCDRKSVDNAFCCADATWPATGNCRCKRLTCEVSFNFGCECGIVDDGPLTSCQPNGSLPNCCAFHEGGCSCSKKLCESFVGTPVAECTTLTTTCPTNGKSVASCSY